MSIVNYNLESTYNHYDVYGCCGGYNRPNKDYLFDICDHALLKTTIQPQTTDSVLFVGAGFGWIAESWIAAGITNVCAVDTSAWIQAEKSTHAVIPIYDYDVTNTAHQELIKQHLGLQSNQKIDWCITEDFYTGLTDQECLDIAVALRSIGTNVLHYISPIPVKNVLQDRNWKTAQDWKTLLTPDSVLIRGTQTIY